jgi:hypothetical protein
MNTVQSVRRVDHSAIRANQAFIITLLLAAFVLNFWPLAAFVSLVMVVGTAVPQLALFQQIYHRLLKPVGIVQPDMVPDNPEPHRFAQGFGGVVLGTGALLLASGSSAGWVLVWLVIVLAGVNLFLGFCAGCFLYYQLNRFGVPGFTHGPLGRS